MDDGSNVRPRTLKAVGRYAIRRSPDVADKSVLTGKTRQQRLDVLSQNRMVVSAFEDAETPPAVPQSRLPDPLADLEVILSLKHPAPIVLMKVKTCGYADHVRTAPVHGLHRFLLMWFNFNGHPAKRQENESEVSDG